MLQGLFSSFVSDMGNVAAIYNVQNRSFKYTAQGGPPSFLNRIVYIFMMIALEVNLTNLMLKNISLPRTSNSMNKRRICGSFDASLFDIYTLAY